mmetsp:Transcript_14246/g.33976  ORF Transcript_14246/g.33976 Transcript_14246/m.33976 type:complete len:207 (+) Transcript_14246:3831-4451(+)
MVAGGMLSLSNACRAGRKPISEIIFTAAGQKSSTILPVSSFTRTGLTLRSTHTADSTRRTGAAGFFMALTSAISLEESVSRAFSASFKAGMASAKASSHSFLMALDWAAASEATASSAATTSLTFSVFALSSFTTIIISPTSLFFSTSFGCSAISSCFIPSTDCSVVVSFSSPTSYLDFRLLIEARLSPSRDLNVWMSSKKDVGVE